MLSAETKGPETRAFSNKSRNPMLSWTTDYKFPPELNTSVFAKTFDISSCESCHTHADDKKCEAIVYLAEETQRTN